METGYILSGRNIVHMTEGSHALHFLYDGQGKPGVVSFNGTLYGYLYNLQGDVIALVDAAGTKVVEYTYDAWGRPTSKTGTLAGTLGTVQPFRYRGYVYDQETGLYYLRSRYYNPVWCRFLNADVVIKGNLYCYCDNNTINGYDPNGKEFIGNPYMSSYYIMSAHDYRKTIKDGLDSMGYDIDEFDNQSDLEVYEIIVDGVASTMTFNQKTGLMTIPNNSIWMELLQEIVVYSSDYSCSGKYYASDIAIACKKFIKKKQVMIIRYPKTKLP